MRAGFDDEDPAGDQGFALIAVLGFLFVVALFVSPFVLQARTSFLVSKNALRLERMDMLADGLIELVASRLLANNGASLVPNLNGVPQSCSNTHLKIGVAVQSHLGLIDLNASGAPLLTLGFKALSFSDDEAEKLARTIIHMRSIRQSGTSAAIYETQIPRKQGPFVSVAELTDINISNHIDHRKAVEVFTVHTRTGRLNLQLASVALRESAAQRDETGLPIFSATARQPLRGVQTISIFLKTKDDRYQRTVTRIVGLGIGTGKPIRSIETIHAGDVSYPANETFKNCSDMFGPEVVQILKEAS